MASAEGLDEEVLELLRLGRDADAATRVLGAYGGELRAYLAHVLRDATAADDAFSECAEQVWRSIGSFRAASSVRAWTYGVAWHAATRTMRDPFRRRGRALESAELARLVDRARTETPIYLKTGTKDALDELRASLDPQDRALLTLRLDRRLSWAEVAVALAEGDDGAGPTTEAALRKRFERIKERLRALAEAKGLLEPK